MRFITEVHKRVQHLIQENATTLLTAGGVVGTVSTAVLAWRGGMKYAQIVEETLREDAEAEGIDIVQTNAQLTNSTKAKLAAPHLLAPVITGTTTVAAIIFSHKMNAQKAAALAAAYGLAEGRLSEYKEKVAEKLTPAKEQKIQDELAQESVNKTPGANQMIVVEGEVLCFDRPTGRYFQSTMESIRSAVNSTNAEILHHDHATASYFYDELGMDRTTWTDEVGWNSSDPLMDLTYSTVLFDGKRPCIAIDFKTLPKLDYVPKHY